MSAHGKRDTPGDAPEKALARVARRCPICGEAAVARYHPFCSKRCADLDLGRWLGEIYRIPAEDDDADRPDSEGARNADGKEG
jgi:endogenous inhibitor of DNA gyrase (YacG/DUF329 family)